MEDGKFAFYNTSNDDSCSSVHKSIQFSTFIKRRALHFVAKSLASRLHFSRNFCSVLHLMRMFISPFSLSITKILFMQNTKLCMENFVKDDKRKKFYIFEFEMRSKREVVFKFVHTFSFLSKFCFIKPERINLLFSTLYPSCTFLSSTFFFPYSTVFEARFDLKLAEYHFSHNFLSESIRAWTKVQGW